MLKKIWNFIVNSVTPIRQEQFVVKSVTPIRQKQFVVKSHCNKHDKYKKGCPTCRSLNGSF